MDYTFLSKTLLFRGTSPSEIQGMLQCLGARQKNYQKHEVVYHAGDTVQDIGLVLSGGVSIENDDVWGNKSILEKAGPGQIFAQAYACMPGEPLMIQVVTTEQTEILFLDMERVLQICTCACSYHNKLVRNLLTIACQQSLHLSRRIFHTAPKSIRARLLSYLSWCASQTGSGEFNIPFNRQQLADYLNVDRSALSNELSKMQRDGLLKFHGSHFILIAQTPVP